MSCFTSVLRSTNWAVGRCRGVLSDRFVWWSDSLWSIHVSSQQRSFLLCASRFFLSNTSCFFGILCSSSWKVFFSVTRIRFRTCGYLLSSLTFALPNWLSPAIYAFALGVLVGWIEVVCPNNFSSWIRQKSWSAMWVAVTLVFFLGFRQPIVPSTQKRKLPPTRNRIRDLRMSSFTTVLRSTNWAIGRSTGVLSDRFVCWSDSLWSIHVSSQQRPRLLCSCRFFS